MQGETRVLGETYEDGGREIRGGFMDGAGRVEWSVERFRRCSKNPACDLMVFTACW